ncbi:hypothetical protein AGMMS49587_01290 [Spirochaetia bacterium]|nr:hypothetical protein AGMMS49587_01290 [Spirochaetia bacterium]
MKSNINVFFGGIAALLLVCSVMFTGCIMELPEDTTLNSKLGAGSLNLEGFVYEYDSLYRSYAPTGVLTNKTVRAYAGSSNPYASTSLISSLGTIDRNGIFSITLNPISDRSSVLVPLSSAEFRNLGEGIFSFTPWGNITVYPGTVKYAAIDLYVYNGNSRLRSLSKKEHLQFGGKMVRYVWVDADVTIRGERGTGFLTTAREFTLKLTRGWNAIYITDSLELSFPWYVDVSLGDADVYWSYSR